MKEKKMSSGTGKYMEYATAYLIMYRPEEAFITDESKLWAIEDPSPYVNQEEMLFKKEAYQNLSKDTKQVITTILEKPELFQTKIRKKVHIRRVLKHYRDLWGVERTKIVEQEIKDYTEQLV